MKARTVTILGRKTDLQLLIGAILLTIFIIINTVCSCSKCKGNKKCNKKCNKPAGSCSSAPSLEKHKTPPPTNVIGADSSVFSDLATL